MISRLTVHMLDYSCKCVLYLYIVSGLLGDNCKNRRAKATIILSHLFNFSNYVIRPTYSGCMYWSSFINHMGYVGEEGCLLHVLASCYILTFKRSILSTIITIFFIKLADNFSNKGTNMLDNLLGIFGKVVLSLQMNWS